MANSPKLHLINILGKFFQEHFQSIKQFGSRSFWPNLGPNDFQKLSADYTSRQSVNPLLHINTF